MVKGPNVPCRGVSERSERRRLRNVGWVSRWMVLVLVCIIPLGSHFVRKELGPLKTAILADRGLGLDNTKFALLLSATAVPNLMVPVVGGAVLDIRGSRIGTMLFLVLTLVGQILFATSLHLRLFEGAIISQLFVGAGAGSTVVSQAAISSEYFRSTEMGLAVGVMESAHNLSNWMGQALPAQIAAYFGGHYISALWAGAICCLISLFAGILYVKADRWAEKQEARTPQTPEPFDEPEEGCCSEAGGGFLKIPAAFFGLALLHLLFSTAHETFDNLSANLITEGYGKTTVQAGFLASIDNVTGLFLAPFVGILLDRFGKRLHIVIVMAVGLILAQCMLAFSITNPVPPLLILSIVNASVPTILRSSVPLVVHRAEWGTAFGIFEAFEAFGTFGGNLAAGFLRDLTSTYAWVNIAFAVFGVVCFAGTMTMMVISHEAALQLALPLPKYREARLYSNTYSTSDFEGGSVHKHAQVSSSNNNSASKSYGSFTGADDAKPGPTDYYNI